MYNHSKKSTGDVNKDLLCHLLTSFLNLRVVPTDWKTTKINMILKLEKNREDAMNCRVIKPNRRFRKFLEIDIKGKFLKAVNDKLSLMKNKTSYRRKRCRNFS